MVGVPTAGQSLLEDRILVGHCVNFLPIRGAWTRDTSVSDYLSATAKRVLDAGAQTLLLPFVQDENEAKRLGRNRVVAELAAPGSA